mgnify:CR=1 FL=1
MKEYEYMEDIATADVALRAYGKTVEEMFINAAKGMENLITNVEKIEPKESRDIEIHATDYFALLYQWLEQLLIYFDTEFMVFSKFNIKIDQRGEEFMLYGKIYGQKVTEDMEIKHEIKAVTYHEMGIEKIRGGFMCQVILDL